MGLRAEFSAGRGRIHRVSGIALRRPASHGRVKLFNRLRSFCLAGSTPAGARLARRSPEHTRRLVHAHRAGQMQLARAQDLAMNGLAEARQAESPAHRLQLAGIAGQHVDHRGAERGAVSEAQDHGRVARTARVGQQPLQSPCAREHSARDRAGLALSVRGRPTSCDAPCRPGAPGGCRAYRASAARPWTC